MPQPDRGAPAAEIILASLLLGERLEVREQACRPIIAGRVAALDLLFDLAPDLASALLEDHKPRAPCLLGFSGLAAALRFLPLRLGKSSGPRDLQCAHPQTGPRSLSLDDVPGIRDLSSPRHRFGEPIGKGPLSKRFSGWQFSPQEPIIFARPPPVCIRAHRILDWRDNQCV